MKAYYIATVLKTVWYCLKDRHKDGQNRMENLETEIQKYAPMIFDKDAQAILWR